MKCLNIACVAACLEAKSSHTFFYTIAEFLKMFDFAISHLTEFGSVKLLPPNVTRKPQLNSYVGPPALQQSCIR
jgi:hypothetical protein